MIDYKKHFAFKYQNNFEKLFLTIFAEKTDFGCSYLDLPSNTCFTNCIKEIISCLKKEKDEIVNSNFSRLLISNFYHWIAEDKLIKEYDYLLYCNLLKTLKEYSEGREVSKIEQYAFFVNVNNKCLYRYRKALLYKIKEYYQNDICSEDSYNDISSFINELLARGLSYYFLNFVYNQYIDGKFSSFIDFIYFLINSKLDSYDIYIPIENFSNQDLIFFEKKKQTIEIKNGLYYCKVYDSNIVDFYNLLNENIIRIESLFNILRFYNNSNVGFSLSSSIIVHSNYFEKEYIIPMSSILKYRSMFPKKNFLEESSNVLEKIKSNSKEEYHFILNVISYAEKDQDVINSSSFIDNWISLETLASMCRRDKGYKAVDSLIPKMICSRVALDDISKKFFAIKQSMKMK